MNKRCSPKQIAKAVIISAMDDLEWNNYLMEHYDPAALKSLDTFVATVYHFTSIFDRKFEPISDTYISENSFSEERFLKFLVPRCETLSQKGDNFGLILSCSFVSEMLRNFRLKYHCFHYDKPSYKYLSEFLESKFKSLKNKSYWNGLLHYCRECNRGMYDRRHTIYHVPLEKPTTSESSEDSGTETIDERIRNKRYKSDTTGTEIIHKNSRTKRRTSDTTRTDIINKRECLAVDTKGFVAEPLNVVFDDSQNDETEQRKLLKINSSDMEKNISSSPIKETDSEYYAEMSEDSDEHSTLIRADFDFLMPDPDYKSKIFGLIKKCETGFEYEFLNKSNNEVTNNKLEENTPLISETVCVELDKTFESRKDAGDLLIRSREEVQISVNEHENKNANKGSNPEFCKECNYKNLNVRLRKWKMTFHKRYKNLSIVSDLFDRKQSNGSESS